ncbi:helix-turn-helix domain-containing protein [Kordia jejudonensis]|uniref:helix-turn-helix domain-containing protein n=1 Tax=Kordia jejudonensis TaxID=1348245 RepID=UPI000629D09F|nr:helix-turn-helix domain-containing protein [Kordia jejudonensis]
MKNKVKFYREQHNLTQTELAKKSGVSLRTIQRIENGSPLKGFTLTAIATALDVSPENLQNDTIDIEKVKMINVATLSFCLIPFGNIILPAILTFNTHNERTKSLGKDIISTQIIWTIITAILLIMTPFIQVRFSKNIPLIIIVLVVLMCINVFIVFKNSIRLTNKSELYIKPKIKLL